MIYNSNQIQEIIPHRYPFLLIDRVEEMSENEIVAIKCISANEMQFMGHFPQKHVMPGVLIVEALAQAGCVLLLSKEEYKNKIAYFAGMNKVRFRKQVIPGDVLKLHVKFISNKANIFIAEIKATVEDKVACSGEIVCAVGE